MARHFRPDGANVPRPGLASGVLETGQNRDVLPSQRKLCARRIDVRKTSIVDENQESFRFYTLLRRGVSKNTRRLIGRRRNVDFGSKSNAPVFSPGRVIPGQRTSARYRNRRAFPKISDERMIARPDRAFCNCCAAGRFSA